MIAVDTPILFDILIGDARHGEASETCVAEALARDEVADQDREFRVLGVLDPRRPRHRADQRLAGRQGLGRDQRELVARIRAAQAVRLLRA